MSRFHWQAPVPLWKGMKRVNLKSASLVSDPNQNLVSYQGLGHLSQHHKNGCSALSLWQSLNQLLSLSSEQKPYLKLNFCMECISRAYHVISFLSCCVWNTPNTYATSTHRADSCKTTSGCFPFDSPSGHKQSCISKSLLPVEYHTSRILHSSSQIIFFSFLIFLVPRGIQ